MAKKYFQDVSIPEAPTQDAGGKYFQDIELPATASAEQLVEPNRYFQDVYDVTPPESSEGFTSKYFQDIQTPTPSPRPSVPSVLLPPAGKDPKRGVREPSPQMQAPQPQQTIQGIGEAFGQFKERMDIGAKDWEINDAISTAINQDDINSLTELQGRRQEMQERTARLAQPDNFWEKAITGVAQILPQQWTGSLKPRLKGAVTGAVGAGVAGTALPIPEEILTVPGGAAWGFKWLGGAESARLWWKQGMAEIYMDMRDDGLSHDEAKLASQIGAVPYAGIELLQFTQFLPKNMRGTPIEVLWREAIKDGTTAILKRGGIEYLKNVAKESGEEGVQEAIKDVTSNIAKSFQNRARDAGYETKGMGEILQRGISATIEAVPAMTLLGLGGSVTDTGVALNRRAKTTNKQQQMDSWREAGAKITDVDKDSFVAELENGKSVGVQFVKDFVDQAKDDPQGFMNSIKTSKAGRKAVDKAMKNAKQDMNKAADMLIKDGWLPKGDTVGATTLTDEQGNTISVDQLIQLEEGYATEGVAQHELWHAAKQLAGVTAEEQAQLDEALDTADITDPQLKEEAEAYAFENYADQNRVLKKVADFIRFVKSGFKQQGEDTQATVENLRDEVVKRLMQEKPAVSEEQKYETLTPERRQAIDSLPDFTQLTPELEQVRGLEVPQFGEQVAEESIEDQTFTPEVTEEIVGAYNQGVADGDMTQGVVDAYNALQRSELAPAQAQEQVVEKKETKEQTARKQLQARARELGVKDTGGNKVIRKRISEAEKLDKQTKKDSQALVKAVTGKDAKTAEPKAETLDDGDVVALAERKAGFPLKKKDGKWRQGLMVYLNDRMQPYKTPLKAKILRVIDGDTVQVSFARPGKAEASEVIDVTRLSEKLSATELRRRNDRLAELSKEERAQVKKDSKEFDDLIFVNEPFTTLDDVNKIENQGFERDRKLELAKHMREARDIAAQELGQEGVDMSDPVVRASMLPALEKYLKDRQQDVDAEDDVPFMGQFSVEQAKQQDLLDQQTLADDFRLIQDEAIDGARVQREKDAKRKAKEDFENAQQELKFSVSLTQDDINKLPNVDTNWKKSNKMDVPNTDKFVDGKLFKDKLGNDPYIYMAKMVDPVDLLETLNLEGKTYQEVANMPTTQRYIEWYKDGKLPPPIDVIKVLRTGKLKSVNRRRVVAAIEAGINAIPASVEIGRASEFTLGKKEVLREQDKRKKAGAKFSVSQEQDAEYLKAVEAGDTAKAQRMVDETVWNNYGSHIKDVYHGSKTKGFKEFDIPSKGFNSNFLGSWEVERNGAFFSDDKATAKEFSEQAGVTGGEVRRFNLLGDYANFESIDEGLFNALVEKGVNERWLYNTQKTWELFDKENDPDGVLPKALKALDYDGAWFEEEGGKTYVVLEPQNIKLADPVTYDDQGNVIPLSERFNAESPDIRFSVSQPAGEVKENKDYKVNQAVQEDKEVDDTMDAVEEKPRHEVESIRDVNSWNRAVKFFLNWMMYGKLYAANKASGEDFMSAQHAVASASDRGVATAESVSKNIAELAGEKVSKIVKMPVDHEVAFAWEEKGGREKLDDRQKIIYDETVKTRDALDKMQREAGVYAFGRGKEGVEQSIEWLKGEIADRESKKEQKKTAKELKSLENSLNYMEKYQEVFEGYAPHTIVVRKFNELKGEKRAKFTNDLELFVTQRKGLHTLREFTEGWTIKEGARKGEKMEPILSPSDLNPMELLAEMAGDAYKRVALKQLYDSMEARGYIQSEQDYDKLVADGQAQGDWLKGEYLKGVSASRLSGKRVHPLVAGAFQELANANGTKKGAFRKMLAVTKVGQFFVPGIVLTYDIMQKYQRGMFSLNPLKELEMWGRAWKSMNEKDETWHNFHKYGGSQKPSLPTHASEREKYQKVAVDVTEAINKWGFASKISTKMFDKDVAIPRSAREALQAVKDNPMAILDAMMLPYRSIGKATWMGDELIRLQSYHTMLELHGDQMVKDLMRQNQGMTQEQATLRMKQKFADYAGKAHGGYAIPSRAFKDFSSLFLFVHTFRLLMPWEQIKSYTDIPKMMYQKIHKGEPMSRAQLNIASRALAVNVLTPFAVFMMMTANGWEPDNEGLPEWWKTLKKGTKQHWKFKKTVRGQDGTKREIVTGINTILNMPTKWIERFLKDKPEKLNDATYHIANALKWEINPMYRNFLDVATNTPSMGGVRPYDYKDKPSKQIYDATLYFFNNTFRIYGEMSRPNMSTAYQRQVKNDLDKSMNGFEKVMLGYFTGYKGVAGKFVPLQVGYSYSRRERRARYGSAKQALDRAIAGEKGNITATYRDMPEVRRKKMRELRKVHIERKRRLREIFLGD